MGKWKVLYFLTDISVGVCNVYPSLGKQVEKSRKSFGYVESGCSVVYGYCKEWNISVL